MKDLAAPIRDYFRLFRNKENVDITQRSDNLFDLLNLEFGLGRNEAEELDFEQIHILLRIDHRFRTAGTEADRRHVLSEIRRYTDGLAIYPGLTDTGRTLVKALRYKFLEPSSVGQTPKQIDQTPQQEVVGQTPEQVVVVPLAVNQTNGENVAPKSLDSRAVGLAHEMLTEKKKINVAAIARELKVDRTCLYALQGFMALVKQDRASHARDKKRWAPGTKDRQTRSVEAWKQAD
jgi:hypothetical protein